MITLRMLSSRERTIAYTALGLLAVALALNTVFAPLLRANDRLNREITVVRAKVRTYLSLIARRDEIRARYRAVAANAAAPVAAADPMVGALTQLENIARASGVTITDVRPQSSGSLTAGLREIAVEIKAEGNMEGFVKFTYDLEHSLALLRVRRFQLAVKPGSSLLEGSFLLTHIAGT
jgi:hypothetical protein